MVNEFNDLKVWQCEDHFYLSLTEVTEVLEISKETILEMVAEEVIQAEADENNEEELQFDVQALRSIQTVARLTHDLNVNLPGAYIIIDLLKEIERLRFHESTFKIG